MDYQGSPLPDNCRDAAFIPCDNKPLPKQKDIQSSIIEEVKLITMLNEENHGSCNSLSIPSAFQTENEKNAVCNLIRDGGNGDAGIDATNRPEPLETKEQTETDSCDNTEPCIGDSKADLENNFEQYEENFEIPADLEIGDRDYNRRRVRRSSKRKLETNEHCPVCGVTVRLPELESHFQKEVENLSKISKTLRKPKPEEKGISNTFVEIKSKRENRLSAKVARYSAKDNEIRCPVCNQRLQGVQDEINKHVLDCINEEESYNELVNVEDDCIEEYEFGNQTRVRAIDLVPGGYRSLLGLSLKKKRAENDDDLNVDVDDTETFGKPQYTELDVIHNLSNVSEVMELEQLRKAVMMDTNIQPHVLESRKWSASSEEDQKDPEKTRNEEKTLIEKIKDMEEDNTSVKCLICLEPYTKPVVSTTCWHVHCEECWLMTMGVKKLCPQCNMIVFPSDLRRIYL